MADPTIVYLNRCLREAGVNTCKPVLWNVRRIQVEGGAELIPDDLRRRRLAALPRQEIARYWGTPAPSTAGSWIPAMADSAVQGARIGQFEHRVRWF